MADYIPTATDISAAADVMRLLGEPGQYRFADTLEIIDIRVKPTPVPVDLGESMRPGFEASQIVNISMAEVADPTTGDAVRVGTDGPWLLFDSFMPDGGLWELECYPERTPDTYAQ
jgi:hypothetical protein